MFCFLPPKNAGPIIFPAVQALDNKRHSFGKQGAPHQRSMSLMANSSSAAAALPGNNANLTSPISPSPRGAASTGITFNVPPSNGSSVNSGAKQQQAKFVVLSFTPPASFEDLLDEGYVDNARANMDKNRMEVITKKALNSSQPSKPQQKAPSPKKKGVKIAEDSNSVIPQPENLFVVERKEEVPVIQPNQRVESSLTAELRPNAYQDTKPYSNNSSYNNSTTSSPANSEEALISIRVFVPHKKGGVHKVTVTINGDISGNELIRMSLELYKTQTGSEPLVDDFRAYLLRVADDDGSPNSGWPVLDKKVSIKELSCDQVVLMLDKNFKLQPAVQKVAPKIDNQVQTQVQQQFQQFLGDIRLEVYLPSGQLAKFVPLSPDVLLKDLLKVLCTKFDLDIRFHDVMQVVGGNSSGGNSVNTPTGSSGASDSQLKPIAKHLKDKTLRTVGLDKIAIVKTVEDDPNDPKRNTSNVNSNDPKHLSAAVNNNLNRQSMVLPSLEPETYTEYIVVKINRFGQRQERRLGIAPDRIYNKFTVDIQSFFKRQKKTKHPERSIEDLISVTYSDNSRAFTLEFTDEVLYYEAKTVVEAAEICKKLTYYLQLRQQQRQAQNKRATRVLQPLFQQQFLQLPQNQNN